SISTRWRETSPTWPFRCSANRRKQRKRGPPCLPNSPLDSVRTEQRRFMTTINTTFPADYVERVYAGVLGKIIGVYLGRPIEGWTYDKISAEVGEVDHYINEIRD